MFWHGTIEFSRSRVGSGKNEESDDGGREHVGSHFDSRCAMVSDELYIGGGYYEVLYVKWIGLAVLVRKTMG